MAARKKVPSRKRFAPIPPAQMEVVPEPAHPEYVPPEPVKNRITIKNCLIVNISECHEVTVSDDGAYIVVVGQGVAL